MSERGDFRCPNCPLDLKGVTLPVRHVCPGSPKRPPAPPRPSDETVTAKAEALGYLDCTHRGDLVERIVCRTCGSRGIEVDVYQCGIHGRCHLTRGSDNRAGMDCRLCAIAGEGFVKASTPPRP